MCRFFSFDQDLEKGVFLYFNAEQRAALKTSNYSNYNPDSHTSIAHFHGYSAVEEDRLTKWEYNFITKKLTLDFGTEDEREKAEAFARNLDPCSIVPELRIHPIVNPFKDKHTLKATKKDLTLLRKWASVRASAWDSVRDSVRASVRASAWDSAWDSVWASVRASVQDSVWDSVWASVRGFALDSVWRSVRAYVSSFFHLEQWKYVNHPPFENPFQPCIELWNRGLVPSYDGTIWCLHGENGKIVWAGRVEIEKKEEARG